MRHARFLAHAIDYVHLVLHQCNQGRHHDGGAFHQERWQLVAERLAASRRHEHEGVIAVKQVADYLLLFSLETFEAEILLQFCRKINIVRHITSGFPFYFVRCAPVRLSRHTASCVFLIWIVVNSPLQTLHAGPYADSCPPTACGQSVSSFCRCAMSSCFLV